MNDSNTNNGKAENARKGGGHGTLGVTKRPAKPKPKKK